MRVKFWTAVYSFQPNSASCCISYRKQSFIFQWKTENIWVVSVWNATLGSYELNISLPQRCLEHACDNWVHKFGLFESIVHKVRDSKFYKKPPKQPFQNSLQNFETRYSNNTYAMFFSWIELLYTTNILLLVPVEKPSLPRSEINRFYIKQ